MTPRWRRKDTQAAPPPPVPAGDLPSLALIIGREFAAPPPLDEIADDVMLAVASVPGQIPEEWQPVTNYAWIAWPHAAGAWIWAREMTAAQLRHLLAGRDAG